MKTACAVLAALALGAEAFSPMPNAPARSSTALNDVWDDYAGGVDYRGKEFKFDPLNLAETYPPLVPWFRECEIRHGRTAMLAVVGFIAEDKVRIPGEMYSFDAIPKTIDAHDALLKTGPMYQLLLFIGLWDIIITPMAMKATGDGEREPGDFGFTQFAPKDPAALAKKKESELLNGRLAMIAVGGIATQSIVTGHGFPYI
eukprot:CAMPEP_0197434556 /NCGR_PEP_ID=MMETSP1175-20131217/2260_1 /TAXON_ID=1003142 /ORGANISM="Triceratium dubium, Strain CCMP147" /LENGTH=200 /DNA_ID=CAMNT_0042963313 /DNA_START=84 /DNA_END=686 /DNA_ORIENTATION=-